MTHSFVGQCSQLSLDKMVIVSPKTVAKYRSGYLEVLSSQELLGVAGRGDVDMRLAFGRPPQTSASSSSFEDGIGAGGTYDERAANRLQRQLRLRQLERRKREEEERAAAAQPFADRDDRGRIAQAAESQPPAGVVFGSSGPSSFGGRHILPAAAPVPLLQMSFLPRWLVGRLHRPVKIYSYFAYYL